VIAWIEADDRPNSKTLVGVEPRTGAVKWQLRLPLNWACETTLTTAGDRIMMLDCPSTKSQTMVTAVDAATGDIAWQRTAPVEFTPQLAVTTDARVVTIPDPDATDGCSLAVIEETGYREATLPEDVECRGALRVVGNQILVSGGRSVIALR
jgi:outer membrane protein assembly factor BamB